ncbi:GMC family oxidoreductase N-terminal domain-containing protein [Acidisoma cellulosilytica]|uniref:GMC family oxidoreductase N-terminal domain-containing protein n=1 Tax=Acidisoma cellulosilyticum TaxID=2802395 RepID=A0A963Z3G7_9PROT|nr:GMC family oxidoreductase N-terminal domain-containing protein [Acidisoma cellulosilyticum]MCB8882085.1 GMC family oxidoreductase N-terminal domain-containing protein [Acidisoma cellulosilyticum]
MDYDYIVCGAGTSGSVVAGRLAASHTGRVLLIEAGGSDQSPLISDPNAWPMTLGTSLDWGFMTDASSDLNGRSIPYSMGKVLGGGSSINVSTWSRGHRSDWDGFSAAAQDKRWSYEAVLELYRTKIEDWQGQPDPRYRGVGGAVHVQQAPSPSAFTESLLSSASDAGLARYPNANGAMMEGTGGAALVDEIVQDGKRKSIFQSYVAPLVSSDNLRVLTDTKLLKILFEKNRAVGVLLESNGQVIAVKARREIVLSAGAINTPRILLQSGIGDPQALRKLGIDVVQALPAVGENLHDHVAFGFIWEKTQEAMPFVPRSESACFWRTDANLDAPNMYTYAIQGAFASPEILKTTNLPENTWSMFVGMRPRSRGRVYLRAADESAPVGIDSGYLRDPKDLDDLRSGLEIARQIGHGSALKRFTVGEAMTVENTRAGQDQFFRDSLVTFWHQCGTAAVGTDEASVVDGSLRVHGIEGLRIADASVLPQVTVGNTMAPCVVIGEQAAGFILSE